MKFQAAYFSVSLVFALAFTLSSFTPTAYADSEWRIPPQQHNRVNPVYPGPRSKQIGQAIYQDECSDCHGRNGFGNGFLAEALYTPIPDLSSNEVISQPDGVLFWKIKRGRNEMPGYRHQLKNREIWHVINYMRSEFE